MSRKEKVRCHFLYKAVLISGTKEEDPTCSQYAIKTRVATSDFDFCVCMIFLVGKEDKGEVFLSVVVY